ncbi:hypothetical protein ABK046_50040, partial [Streptomyces caeruleatus]
SEKTIEAAKAIAELYALPMGGSGGYAHIVTDDGNLADHNVDWCISAATNKEDKTLYNLYDEDIRTASLKALKLLKPLSITQ